MVGGAVPSDVDGVVVDVVEGDGDEAVCAGDVGGVAKFHRGGIGFGDVPVRADHALDEPFRIADDMCHRPDIVHLAVRPNHAKLGIER